MAQQKYYTILTEVGKSKIANATVLNEKVQFSKMQLGDGGGSQYEPHEKQTELKNRVWEGSISNVKVDENNPNWIVVETAIPGNSGGFTVREVGLFDNAGELLAVGKYPETYKPVVDDGCVKDLFVRVILMVVNTSAITLKIDPTVILASMKDLNDLRKEVSTKIDTAKTELNSKIYEVRSDLDSIELTAEKVSVKDVNNNFTSANTEGVLQELAGKDKSLDTKIDSTKSDLTNQFDHFTGEIDNLKQSVSSGKELIATAVTGKDVPTNGSDTFQKMADNIDSIKTKLPILEGDVGVAEDSGGNEYNVKLFSDRRKKVGSTYTDIIVNDGTSSYNNIVELKENLLIIKVGDRLQKYDFDLNNIGQFIGSAYNQYIALDGFIYGVASSRIDQIDETGKIIKTTIVEDKKVMKCLVYSNGYFYIGSSTGEIYKISKDFTKNTKITPYSLSIQSITTDKNNNVYFGNEKNRLTKLNGNNEFIWTKEFENTTKRIEDVEADSRGDIYIVGTDNILRKINSNGNIIWSYENGYNAYFRTIFIDEEDFIYVGSYPSPSSSAIQEIPGMMFVFSPNGDIQYIRPQRRRELNSIYKKDKNNLFIGGSFSTLEKIKENYTVEKNAIALLERRI
ncbi:phage tail protein [Metaclostridioides mangenotii]|uniref:Phage tail fibre protein N-terminal domain-containing protein n=1 Tax=Metaclostridioides mangenotii TaxID=1540 RepID=A0ABS4E907_9FIRM|nr:phage tail protein [Clostridioides mangenotii]MBP1854429.1 hypothetical protein [Clostridioides mangenotii]